MLFAVLTFLAAEAGGENGMDEEGLRHPGIGDSIGDLLRHPSPATFAPHMLRQAAVSRLACDAVGDCPSFWVP